MVCKSCGKPQCACKKDCFSTGAAVVINNPTEYVNFRKVVIPASAGDEKTNPPTPGRYCNVLLVYEATGAAYLYSSDRVPTLVSEAGEIKRLEELIHEETDNREEADARIWEKIEHIELASDVVDIVGTYAQLQHYDTSSLTDRDIIKVLSDETHGNAIGYYRWNLELGQFQFLGKEGPYYTTTEVDELLNRKQNLLTAGYGIDIEQDVISGVPFNVTNNDWSNLWQ